MLLISYRKRISDMQYSPLAAIRLRDNGA